MGIVMPSTASARLMLSVRLLLLRLLLLVNIMRTIFTFVMVMMVWGVRTL